MFEKVWFGFDRWFGKTHKITGFGLSDWVWFGLLCLFQRQTNKWKNYLILINFICLVCIAYAKDKQTKK